MRQGWRKLAGTISVLSALLGCAAESPTGMVVEVDTNLEIPGVAEALRLRVREGDRLLHELSVDLNAGGPQAKLPGRLALRPADPADSAIITVEAAAMRGAKEVLRHQAQLRFRRGAVVLLRLPLLAECLCQVCATGETCEAGPRCVPQAREPDSLPLYQPGLQPASAGAQPASSCEPADAAEDTRAVTDALAATDVAEGAADLPGGPLDAGADRPGMAPDAGQDATPDARPADATALLPTGAPCSLRDQCASRSCTDGVCCSSSCGSLCMACTRARTGAADGTCAPILAGTDPRGDCAADPPGTCRYDGTCDGAGACRLYGPSTLCGSPSCTGGDYLAAARCSGAGACGQSPAQACGLFACTLDRGCLTGCQSDGQCVAGAYCSGAACAPRKPNGQMCTEPRECLSNMCPGNRCVGN